MIGFGLRDSMLICYKIMHRHMSGTCVMQIGIMHNDVAPYPDRMMRIHFSAQWYESVTNGIMWISVRNNYAHICTCTCTCTWQNDESLSTQRWERKCECLHARSLHESRELTPIGYHVLKIKVSYIFIWGSQSMHAKKPRNYQLSFFPHCKKSKK